MLYVLVVIHNRTCAESIACRSLKAQTDQDFHVLIYDNSDTDFGIKAECRENGWVYLGGTGNLGLPVAYNCALDHLMKEKAEGYICLLDDDTQLGPDFIAETKAAFDKKTSGILLPVLSQNGKILSPWREKGRRHFNSFEESSTEPVNNILAFNSGMVISLDVFRDYRYDERLFLDCVDISFLTEMKKRGKTISVIPAFGKQNFSGEEKPSKDTAFKRFKIYTKDMHAYYGEESFAWRFQLFKRALHLSMIYRSIQPFAILRKERENWK